MTNGFDEKWALSRIVAEYPYWNEHTKDPVFKLMREADARGYERGRKYERELQEAYEVVGIADKPTPLAQRPASEMTVREKFALEIFSQLDVIDREHAQVAAESAVFIADALIRALSQETGG